MVKSETTDSHVESYQIFKDLKSHQDYSNWVITGNRYYMTNLDWTEVNNEAEEVISVNGEDCICESCMKVGPGLKLTTNTPSFHNNNFSICLSCTKKTYSEEGRKLVSEEDIIKYFVDSVPKIVQENVLKIDKRNDSEESKIEAMLRYLHELGKHKYCVDYQDKHVWESNQV